MKTSGVKSIGRLRYQLDQDPTDWYYMSRKDEKVNMKFFIGSVDYDTGDLNQIIIGPMAISWGWAE